MSALFGRHMRVMSSAKKWEWGGWHPNTHDTYEFTHGSQPAGVNANVLLPVWNMENQVEPDPVRRNPPQSDQTAEGFLLTGWISPYVFIFGSPHGPFRNVMLEACPCMKS